MTTNINHNEQDYVIFSKDDKFLIYMIFYNVDFFLLINFYEKFGMIGDSSSFIDILWKIVTRGLVELRTFFALLYLFLQKLEFVLVFARSN